MKKAVQKLIFFFSLCLCALLIVFVLPCLNANAVETSKEDFNYIMQPMPLSYVNSDSSKDVKDLISEMQKRENNAHEMAQRARALGYPENHPVIKLAQAEWWQAEDLKKQYNEQLNMIKKNTIDETYPVASQIWYYLDDYGFNDYVKAGILGNIMAEVGGQTLDIKHLTSGKGYYGMCQWSNYYYPDVIGEDLDGQCEFLINTMQKEFDSFGFCYESNFNYTKFLNLNNEQSAALAFALCYERCGDASYWVRQKNATIAYNYFVD